MINEEIKAAVVKVVNEESKELTEMATSDALQMAYDQGLDLILLNGKGDIPIVKIGDYSKLLYEKQKKEKENKKKQRLSASELKEIQISDAIAEHDLMIKAKNVDRLIQEGNRVMLSIRYKGRSIRFINNGPQKLQELANKVRTEVRIDKVPKIEGNRVTMVLAPVVKK